VFSPLRRPPWLLLVTLAGFTGQVMLQPNWHTTGDAAESMTPIVILGLAYVAREIAALPAAARRAIGLLVLAECAAFWALYTWWAFGSAWTRDPNVVLAMRYGLQHVRFLWPPAVPLGALAIAAAAVTAGALLWCGPRIRRPARERSALPGALDAHLRA
jgi:hypothetical protein